MKACTRRQELVFLVKAVLEDDLGYHQFDKGQCRQLQTTARHH